MRIAVLGTGQVGRTLGTGFLALGHEVVMGSRTRANPTAVGWAEEHGAACGTFADACSRADLVVLAGSGQHALAILEAAGDLTDTVVWDVTNPLDFSQGFPPSLTVCNTDSLAEQLQRAHPGAHVVKALNMVANAVMVDPSRVPGESTLILCGDSPTAKETVTGVLRALGWADVVDLGGLDGARGMEAWLLLWTRLYGALGTGDFNLKLVR